MAISLDFISCVKQTDKIERNSDFFLEHGEIENSARSRKSQETRGLNST